MPTSGEGSAAALAAALLLLLQKLGAELATNLTDPLLRDTPSTCTGTLGGKGAAKTIPYFLVVNHGKTQFIVFLKPSF